MLWTCFIKPKRVLIPENQGFQIGVSGLAMIHPCPPNGR